jgi:hypothetical protein
VLVQQCCYGPSVKPLGAVTATSNSHFQHLCVLPIRCWRMRCFVARRHIMARHNLCVFVCVVCLQALFRRAQLKALVGLHSSAEGLGGNLSADEISIITGALDLTSKTACTAMTPLDKVCMVVYVCKPKSAYPPLFQSALTQHCSS